MLCTENETSFKIFGASLFTDAKNDAFENLTIVFDLLLDECPFESFCWSVFWAGFGGKDFAPTNVVTRLYVTFYFKQVVIKVQIAGKKYFAYVIHGPIGDHDRQENKGISQQVKQA